MNAPAGFDHRNDPGIVGWLARRWYEHRVRCIQRAQARARARQEANR